MIHFGQEKKVGVLDEIAGLVHFKEKAKVVMDYLGLLFDINHIILICNHPWDFNK